MAKLIAQPDVVEFLDHIMIQQKNDVYLEEISFTEVGECFINKSIRDLGVRNLSGANIVGLRNSKGEYTINPNPDVILTCDDKLFVLGTPEQIQKLHNLLREIKWKTKSEKVISC